MSIDNNTGIRTRAMAQCIDNEAEAEQLQGAPNADMNPTVELHRTKGMPSRSLYESTAPLPLIGMYQTFVTLE